MNFNCPDCPFIFPNCQNCKRCNNTHLTTFPLLHYSYYSTIPQSCLYCSNHPINGGTGICNCTLGLPTIYC